MLTKNSILHFGLEGFLVLEKQQQVVNNSSTMDWSGIQYLKI